ncbi:MAG: proline dehydrogenase family protein, partial [Pirellulaceae bacterium]
MANRIDGDTPTNSLADWLTQLPQRLHGQGPQISFRDAPVVEAALELARMLQRRAMELQTPQEKRQQAELDRMIQHPGDKATLTQFTDQGFRSQSANRSVDQLVHILDVQGVPRFFGSIDWTLMKGFQSFGGYLPGVAVPLVKEKMRRETANVILPAEEAMLREHLKERRSEGVRMNVNFLGEAILGEKEAQRRLEGYLASLQLPEIECVSVKISTLYSQISALARRSTLRVLGERLEWLYRAALKETFQQKDGTKTTKFVYLDMEEYRDMWLTAELFMRTLDQPGLEQVRAGIALQAYLPDSFLVQEEITRWAMERRKRGGGPVTIRVVKGANMEMERVESSVRGWPQAPYKIKLETDANYKKIVQYGMEPARLDAVHLGIASHNLFDVAYALVLATQVQAGPRVQFEMLEGMANHQRRALFEATKRLLLYAPACHREEFINAIGYLIRRLDENTGPDNFLRHAFRITVDGSTWKRLEGGFLESLRMVDTISNQPRRTQDRRSAPCQPPPTQKVSPLDGQSEWLNQSTSGATRAGSSHSPSSSDHGMGPKAVPRR